MDASRGLATVPAVIRERLGARDELALALVENLQRRDLSPLEEKALTMWEHCLTHLENDPLKLDREVDWVIKYKLLEAFRDCFPAGVVNTVYGEGQVVVAVSGKRYALGHGLSKKIIVTPVNGNGR